jgi:hypothetical protein
LNVRREDTSSKLAKRYFYEMNLIPMRQDLLRLEKLIKKKINGHIAKLERIFSVHPAPPAKISQISHQKPSRRFSTFEKQDSDEDDQIFDDRKESVKISEFEIVESYCDQEIKSVERGLAIGHNDQSYTEQNQKSYGKLYQEAD